MVRLSGSADREPFSYRADANVPRFPDDRPYRHYGLDPVSDGTKSLPRPADADRFLQ